ncbi:MAG TPA: hypothetical protein PLW61_07435, partial [Caldisericia bacterium]|nr:hypothetical protein [Caldisericia bacterium]
MKNIKIIILICLILILNISYNKICLGSDTNINQNDNIFSPPWDYNKYYLYPITYTTHNNGPFGAVDLYYFKNKNTPNEYTYNRNGDGGIEIFAANDGEVYINLYYMENPINTSDKNWTSLNIINNN